MGDSMCAMIHANYIEALKSDEYICERCGCDLTPLTHYDDSLHSEPENPVYFDENHGTLCQECLLYLHRRDAD